ncbi:2-epi-5-epi-valiolone synthase [Streptomyces griseocarneus]|nr:2-epi-5-epi-valiolone synthase [Streptomyces griseocarneus]
MYSDRRRWEISTQLPVRYEIIETSPLLSPDNPDLLMQPEESSRPATRLVVLDDSIESLYGSRVRDYLRAHDVDHRILVLPGLERNKNMSSVHQVLTALNEVQAARRNNPPIAIGGGVLLDVVGLAAGLYRRGIPYVRVPTTLLGMVDVGVAAKTGVNYEGFRNRLGTYSPPPFTLIDKSFLTTLPERQLRNGLGEILKMGLIKDARLFSLLERHGAELVEGRFQSGVADEVIGRSIQGMAEELEPNLWEKHLKRAVDHGHSFSPLIEMSVIPELLHGEAVALDCLYSAFIALDRSFIAEEDVRRVLHTMRSIGLPTFHPLFGDPTMLRKALDDTVRHRNGDQNLPVMTRVGEARFINDLTDAEIARAAERMSFFSRELTGCV